MYLGLDLGTSGVKALVIDENQRHVAQATAPLMVDRPYPGWSQQAPSAWVAATERVLDELAGAGALRQVKGIGLSGQMHGAVMLDGSDQPIAPCILWNDTRAQAEAVDMDADPDFRAITGNIVFPGFTAPKLAWLRKAEPATFDRLARVLLPKDFLRLWLTVSMSGRCRMPPGQAGSILARGRGMRGCWQKPVFRLITCRGLSKGRRCQATCAVICPSGSVCPRAYR